MALLVKRYLFLVLYVLLVTQFVLFAVTQQFIKEELETIIEFFGHNGMNTTVNNPSKRATKSSPVQQTQFPPQCSVEQLEVIQHQLPGDLCRANAHRPWNNKCSFVYATKCPEPGWINEYFRQQKNENPVAIYIGCNKGMDAVDTLRMISHDPRIDKNAWRDEFLGTEAYEPGHCQQEHTEQWQITPTAKANKGVTHCVEAMPITYRRLNRTAHKLDWQRQLNVVHAAIGQTDGEALFPSNQDSIGVEGRGLGDCRGKNPVDCEQVPMLTFDTFMKQHVPPSAYVDLLSVDVEGFDWEVLNSGIEHLRRVRYMEFEYSWKGPWLKTNLSTAIDTLKALGFVCYFAGANNHLWRITDCFLDYYDLHFWSNVACVNANDAAAETIAAHMEELFLATIKVGKELRYDTWPKKKDYFHLKNVTGR